MANTKQIMIWVKYQTPLGKIVFCIHMYYTHNKIEHLLTALTALESSW